MAMDSKTRYERVITAVRYNTGGAQPPLASERAIRSICCSTGPLEVDEYQRALQAAIENDDLLEWHGHLAVAEPEPLQAVIEAEVASDSPQNALIGHCNQLLDEVESG